MNCVMTIGTAVDQGQACAVVVRRMTLQAERRLADRQHVLIGRTMRGMALKATLIYRSMLEGKWPLIFGMAVQTELVSVG